MYARVNEPLLETLPAGYEKADDATLATIGIYHVAEIAPEFDPLTETTDEITGIVLDKSRPIPRLVATLSKRALTKQEIADRLAEHRAEMLAASAAEIERAGTAVIDHGGAMIPADEKSLALLEAARDAGTGMTWTRGVDVPVTLDATAVADIITRIDAQRAQAESAATARDGAILAAQDRATLEILARAAP